MASGPFDQWNQPPGWGEGQPARSPDPSPPRSSRRAWLLVLVISLVAGGLLGGVGVVVVAANLDDPEPAAAPPPPSPTANSPAALSPRTGAPNDSCGTDSFAVGDSTKYDPPGPVPVGQAALYKGGKVELRITRLYTTQTTLPPKGQMVLVADVTLVNHTGKDFQIQPLASARLGPGGYQTKRVFDTAVPDDMIAHRQNRKLHDGETGTGAYGFGVRKRADLKFITITFMPGNNCRVATFEASLP